MAKKAKVLLDDQERIDSLKETHELYGVYFDEWIFLNCAYEGVKELLAWGVLKQHERESNANYERRKEVAYGFSYSKSVIDIFNSYLFKKEFPTVIPEKLAKDELWKVFIENCDLDETEFDDFFVEQQRNASIEGHMGILVDRPNVKLESRKDEIDEKIYPYLAAYKPTNILDWEYQKDIVTGKRKLVYLKILDDDNHYRIWTPDTWEEWEIIDADGKTESISTTTAGKEKSKKEVLGRTARKVGEGKNALGEIPFVWLYNQRSTKNKELGSSDITDVARIDSSIIRNLSQLEEIIDYAAFPMMRKPKVEAGGTETEQEVGVTGVLWFDPDHPESKPDWLSSEVEGPINAILNVISKKIGEIYRSSNIGGMSATEMSKDAKSGVALRTEFQLLNSKLIKKAKNTARARRQTVYFWLKWQNIFDDEKLKEEMKFDYPATFELDDLATDLENILTSSVIVGSSVKFSKEIQKLVVRWVLPTADEEVLADIDKEIEDGTYEGMGNFFQAKNGNEPPDENNPQQQKQVVKEPTKAKPAKKPSPSGKKEPLTKEDKDVK